MSLADVTAGMKVILSAQGSREEYHTEILAVESEKVIIKSTAQLENCIKENAKKQYSVRIVVNNTVYLWNNVELNRKSKTEDGQIQLVLEGKPNVLNRRKHPRLPLTNSCDIFLKSKNRSYPGRVVNISAGGFAFACKDEEFASANGEMVQLTIHDFELLQGQALPGFIIRSSDDNGTYIVGCRMPEDHEGIQKYVSARMK